MLVGQLVLLYFTRKNALRAEAARDRSLAAVSRAVGAAELAKAAASRAAQRADAARRIAWEMADRG